METMADTLVARQNYQGGLDLYNKILKQSKQQDEAYYTVVYKRAFLTFGLGRTGKRLAHRAVATRTQPWSPGTAGHPRRRDPDCPAPAWREHGFRMIEDASGRVEIALYREALTEFAALLVKDQVVIVDGALSPDDTQRFPGARAQCVVDGAGVGAFRAACACASIGCSRRWSMTSARSLKSVRFGMTLRIVLQYRWRAGRSPRQDDWRIRVVPGDRRARASLPGVQGVDISLMRASSS